MFSPNHVSVTVISAKNLTGKGKNGKNDAFVVIQLAEKKFQTSIQKKATAPYWNEECEFSYENKYSDLILTAYHRNLLGFDEFLGQLRLPLDEVYEPPRSLNPNDRPPSRWFPLKGKSGKKEEHKYRGELEIRLLFSRKETNENEAHSGGSRADLRQDCHASFDSSSSTGIPPPQPPPVKGLKKKDFMGSMPSLGDNQKLSLPPSPTASISSVKKRSLFSKLKQSSSFHVQHDRKSTASSGMEANLKEQSFQKRLSFLGPVDEDGTEIFKRGGDSTTSLEPDDPDPVIRAHKRAGGMFAIGGGQKQRPASAIISSDRISALPNRMPITFGMETGEGRQQPSSLASGTQGLSMSNLPSDGTPGSAATEELQAVVEEQRTEIRRQRIRIRELEDYIDRLLLRVITTQPELLRDISWDQSSKDANGDAVPSSKSARFHFGMGK